MLFQNKICHMFIVGQIKFSWLILHEQAICFSSLIWLSQNKSVKKSRFSRIVKNSREFSLLDLEAFWFHFSLLEKEWKHFIFTLHFSKKSESFLFSLLELQTPTLAGPWTKDPPARVKNYTSKIFDLFWLVQLWGFEFESNYI